jgi:hypothetical protein
MSPVRTNGSPVASIFTSADIGAFVGADRFRLELALVGQRDDDLLGALDNVSVRHHVAVTGQDETRTDAALLRLAFRRRLLRAAPRIRPIRDR